MKRLIKSGVMREFRQILRSLLLVSAFFCAWQTCYAADTTDELKLVNEVSGGKMFNTGDDTIQVLQLKGSWFEMGQQYGALTKTGCSKSGVRSSSRRSTKS